MRERSPGVEPTSLYAKLFINGFTRACHVVLVAELSSAPEPALVEAALRDVLEREPRLRSTVEMSRLGVPTRFVHHTVDHWLEAGGLRIVEGFDPANLEAFRQEALAAPMDLRGELPVRVWLLRGTSGAAIVVKAHHAVIDARTSRPTLLRFVQRYRAHAAGQAPPVATSGPRPARARLQWATEAWAWLRSARLDARVPEVSVLADPGGAGAGPPHTRCAVRVLPIEELSRLNAAAARAGVTFPQLVCAATLRAFGAYNARRVGDGRGAPPRVGLMVAASRRPSAARPADDAPSVDTILLSVDTALLAAERNAELQRHVRAALHRPDTRHNGVMLWAFYAARRLMALRGIAPAAATDSVHVLYSDASSLATSFRRPLELTPGVTVERLHYVASPVAPDQAMLVTYAYGSELRVALMHDDGVIRGDELLDDLIAALRTPTEKEAS